VEVSTADIYYDGGISLNPAVDIGQVHRGSSLNIHLSICVAGFRVLVF
jgi:hypothetical protein